jgi:hypothetical protein
MWSSTQGEPVVKDVIATAQGVRQGIDRLLRYFNERCPHPIWNEMVALDYEADVAAIQSWLESHYPFPEAVEVLWFAFWDVTDGFNLRGSTHWSKDPEDWEWWYEDDFRGKRYGSPVLEQMHALARRVDDPVIFPRKKNGVWDLTDYLLTIGYVGLAVAQVCRSTDRRRLLGGRSERWVVTGFPDAVYGIIVGKVTPDGFEPFRG